MKNDYKISIIILLLKDKDVNKTLDSLINQTYDINNMEIIIIDSKLDDNNTLICQEYKDKYSNIEIYESNDYNLSSMKNIGIKKAQSRYLTFIESGDIISNNSIEQLINFFEENYNKIDLVTYPIDTVFNDNKRISFSKYSFCDSDVGIYSLSEYPYFNQIKNNIIIKNNSKKLFDEKTSFGSDVLFLIEKLKEKGKIGYVSHALYTNNSLENNTSLVRKMNPYYIYDESIKLYETIVAKYFNEKNVNYFAQALVLNDIYQKIKSDVIFPCHLKGNEYINAYNRLINVIKKIDNKIINNYPYKDMFIKFYLYKLQDKNAQISFMENNKYSLLIEDQKIYESKTISILFTRMKCKNNKLNIIGVIKSPLLLYFKPNLYLEYKTKKNEVKIEKLNLFFSNYSYNYKSIKYNNFHGFECQIDLTNISEYKFYIDINDHKIYGKYEFEIYAPIQPKIKRYNFTYKKYKIIYKSKEEKFIIFNNTLLRKIKKIIKENLIYLKKDPMMCLYRLLGHTTKEIWLYQDRGDMHDNGFIQYQNDINKKDGIKRYYIGTKNDEKIKKFVKFKSLKHKILYLKSSKIITSFIDRPEYCPFLSNFIYYRDIVHYDLIYLQHGILHAKLLSMYSKEYTEIDKIVVSSKFELNNLITNYNYKKEDLITSGMPRMKNSEKRNINSKKIVFAPSWRKYLIGQYIKGKRKNTNDIFINSEFYKKINCFLNSKELKKILDEKNMSLEFKLHPIFKGYKDLFEFKDNRISISFDEIDAKEYAIFITDFSSFQFDFAKLEIPIIYFLPDESEFNSGLHTYKELDLHYEDAFGNLCCNEKDLLKELKKVVNNNCIPEKKYLDRMKAFFTIANNPCEEIYKTISQK